MVLAEGACFGAFAALGFAVARRAPGRLDTSALALRGRAFGLAVFFTRLGRWYGVVAVTLVAVSIAAALHHGVAAVIALFVAQLLAQGAVHSLKLAFRRDRPDDPLHRFERGHSYPSGHAATAGVFFGGLLLLVVRSSDVPSAIAAVLTVLLSACIVGIPWSRLALGAHYLSDVAGGLLFGVGWLAGSLALAASLNQSGLRL
jgi:membrane-associated phospholipid phosphatase